MNASAASDSARVVCDDVGDAAEVGERDEQRGLLPREAQDSHDGGLIRRRVAGRGHIRETGRKARLRIARKAARKPGRIGARKPPKKGRMIGESFEQSFDSRLVGERAEARGGVRAEQFVHARARLARIG